jgi:hypothetical protein
LWLKPFQKTLKPLAKARGYSKNDYKKISNAQLGIKLALDQQRIKKTNQKGFYCLLGIILNS